MFNYLLMNRKTYSDDYDTVRLSYPPELDNKCIICGSEVKYCYSDNGKLVHTLEGDIYQVVNYYSCTNEDCELSKIEFNPSPRLDYSGRHFGADVFRFISNEFLIFKQKCDQILLRLKLKHQLEISIDTVRRMYEDVLQLKSKQIDENTKEIVQKQGFILLGLDGQDPGGDAPSIWCFMDLISNRILATRKFDSLDYKRLRETIEEIENLYGVKIIGWVSDKQNVITKCHDEYYSDVPHQYCQFHFLRNTWRHLTALDSNVYLPLKKAINGLYIHSASTSTKIHFENVGKASVREAFENTDKDLQTMLKVKNKTLKELRGTWLYETVEKYANDMEAVYNTLDPTLRFSKIMKKTIAALKEALTGVEQHYKDSKLLFEHFQKIRTVFGKETLSQEEKIERLNEIYDQVFAIAKERDPTIKFEECKAFLPSKKKTTVEILGEWCRLWKSYLPGLFEYFKFPKAVKTNLDLEKAFSVEKQAIYSRVAKANVWRMVATRGEDYLRIKHCELDELASDIVLQYSEEVIRQLREQLNAAIKEVSAIGRARSKQYKEFDADVKKYIRQKIKKKEAAI
ncbi:MAG: hypothetical protein GF311_12010 [Candidatus Lokiarchaeota archaeon]|nr:hypothetical protein [Candidatus Lokiarchaeota archaeon]